MEANYDDEILLDMVRHHHERLDVSGYELYWVLGTVAIVVVARMIVRINSISNEIRQRPDAAVAIPVAHSDASDRAGASVMDACD